MTTANEKLQSSMIKHQAELEWLANHTSDRMVELLRRTEPRIIERIAAFIRRNRNHKQYEWKRLEALRAVIRTIRKEGWTAVGKELNELAMQLAIEEARHWPNELREIMPTQIDVVAPTAATMREIVKSKPIHGRVMSELVSKMFEDDMVRISTKVQAGMLAGETLDNMMRTLFGSERLEYRDGATTLTQSQLKTVARTVIHHVASDARAEFVKANAAELGGKERFVATLDSRTTPLCGSLDGKLFNVGEGPQPPLHYNCRSARVFFVDSESQLHRPFVSAVEKDIVREYTKSAGLKNVSSRNALPYGHKTKFDKFAMKRKRELIGTIPGDTKFADWFANQSKSFQVKALGETRAELYRLGGLKLDKFQDISGRKLTLTELYAQNKSAFTKAGVKPQ